MKQFSVTFLVWALFWPTLIAEKVYDSMQDELDPSVHDLCNVAGVMVQIAYLTILAVIAISAVVLLPMLGSG